MKTFKEWVKEEGLWLPDSSAEETGSGIRAKLKSKRGQPMGGMGAAGMGMGGMPPAMMKKKMKKMKKMKKK